MVVRRYTNRAVAEQEAFVTASQPSAVVLGDDGTHWVVTLALAARLERQGYAVAYLPGR